MSRLLLCLLLLCVGCGDTHEDRALPLTIDTTFVLIRQDDGTGNAWWDAATLTAVVAAVQTQSLGALTLRWQIRTLDDSGLYARDQGTLLRLLDGERTPGMLTVLISGPDGGSLGQSTIEQSPSPLIALQTNALGNVATSASVLLHELGHGALGLLHRGQCTTENYLIEASCRAHSLARLADIGT